jgi:Phage-related lysozyme (muraminidase)
MVANHYNKNAKPITNKAYQYLATNKRLICLMASRLILTFALSFGAFYSYANALDINKPAIARAINQAGVELIKNFEKLPDGDPSTVNIDPYFEPAGTWTIGWGHTIVADGKPLKGKHNKNRARALYPRGLTKEQAEALLHADLMNACRDVVPLVRVPLSDNQLAALVSLTYNIGIGNFKRSTLLRLLNAGNYKGAAREFMKWNRLKGRVLAGLSKRRAAEVALFKEVLISENHRTRKMFTS